MKKVCATGPGSARPVVSITTRSKSSSPLRFFSARSARVVRRSSRMEQQTQPLFNWMICSVLSCTRISLSMFSEPNSFSITAIFWPWASVKTTLLKRVLTEAHGQKIAVIENEFGSENIDNEILVQDSTEQIIQLNNGCVCCSIREDLRTTLADLAEKRRKGEISFDRVVIETTGLADPGPVAQTFFMDDEVAETYLLDSVLTLVDAKHGQQQLDDRQEARRQVGFADQIFISKTDLVDGQTVDALIHRIKHMNPRAKQTKVNFGDVPLADVFDLRGFNLNAKLDIDPEFLNADVHAGHDHDHEGHDHEHDENCDHPHHHVHD